MTAKWAKEVLIKARELVSKGWTQGRFAANKKDETVNYGADDAVCFCASGAIYRAAKTTRGEGYSEVGTIYEAHRFLRESTLYNGEVPAWNDAAGRRQREVVRAFSVAIEKADREASVERD